MEPTTSSSSENESESGRNSCSSKSSAGGKESWTAPSQQGDSSSEFDDDGTLCGLSPESNELNKRNIAMVARLRLLLTAERRLSNRHLIAASLNQRLGEIMKSSYQQRNSSCQLDDPSSRWVSLSARLKRENPEKLIADSEARKTGGKASGAKKPGGKGGDGGSNPIDVWTRKILIRSGRDRRLYDAVLPLLHRLGYRGRAFTLTSGGFAAKDPGVAVRKTQGGARQAPVVELLLLDTIGTLADSGVTEVFVNFDTDSWQARPARSAH